MTTYCFAPNICYETVIPHVIRRQVATLDDRSEPPDVLVNLTNDAWYWGSSELDMHLACGVFRAVETRRPLVIAANGGISAWIDQHGRVRAQSPRQQAGCNPGRRRASCDAKLVCPTSATGSPALCLTCCVCLAMVGHRRAQPALRRRSASLRPLTSDP